MFGLVKKVFRPIRQRAVKRSPYPHIDAMSSADLSAFMASDEVTMEEFEYAVRRRGWLVRG